jgi:hypothetical protein
LERLRRQGSRQGELVTGAGQLGADTHAGADAALLAVEARGIVGPFAIFGSICRYVSIIFFSLIIEMDGA